MIEADRVWKGYPTEKPVAVNEILVRQSTKEGDLVVDPFISSGLKRRGRTVPWPAFLGNDLSQEAIAITKRRL